MVRNTHYVKNVCIRIYSGPHFPAFGVNTERYSVSLHIQPECGKMRTRITPNADTFYSVISLLDPIFKSTSQRRTQNRVKQRYAKIIFVERSILGVCQVFEYTSASNLLDMQVTNLASTNSCVRQFEKLKT